MIYICENCHFEFERMSEVEQCPDCGKMAIRPAAPQEAKHSGSGCRRMFGILRKGGQKAIIV